MENDDVLQMRLQDLNEERVGKWIEKAKQILEKIQKEFASYQLENVELTASAAPSVKVVFKKKPSVPTGRKGRR